MPKSLTENLNLCFTITNPPQPPQKSIFNSLYDPLESTSTSNSLTNFTSGDFSANISGDNSDDISFTDSDTPDISTILTSHRFFFTSPGNSNSIIDSSSSKTETTFKPKTVGGGIAVPKLSPDPYSDFRLSMEEMVEARESVDWDYLHELLTCYLSLNAKSSHKFIMKAFADVLVNLLP